MRALAARRLARLALFAAACVGLLLWQASQARPLDAPERTTGWLLLGAVAFLALYNGRKKIAIVPLGSSAAWLQAHVYVGLFAILVFLVHTGGRAPTGSLETSLAVLFLLVAASGVAGLYVSRRVPARLARRGEEVLYERIPALTRQVAARAEQLALDSVGRTRARAIADFHAAHLRAWFTRPCDAWAHLTGWGAGPRRRERAVAEFRSLLDPEGAQVFDELVALARQKEDLDYHRAHQGLLKHWFFVHLPLTYALLLFVAAHAVLVYAFGSQG